MAKVSGIVSLLTDEVSINFILFMFAFLILIIVLVSHVAIVLTFVLTDLVKLSKLPEVFCGYDLSLHLLRQEQVKDAAKETSEKERERLRKLA